MPDLGRTLRRLLGCDIRHADVAFHMQQAAMAAGFAGALDLGWDLLTRPKARSKSGKDDEDSESSSFVAALALVELGLHQRYQVRVRVR